MKVNCNSDVTFFKDKMQPRCLARLFIVVALLLSLILGCYYLFVLSLSVEKDVSEAYTLYYIDKKNHFYNRYQDLRVVRDRIYDTTYERPFFVSREGFDYPSYNGSGMPFMGQGGFYFMLHRSLKQAPLCLLLEFEPEKKSINKHQFISNLKNANASSVHESLDSIELIGDKGITFKHNFSVKQVLIEVPLNKVPPVIYKITKSGPIYNLALKTSKIIYFKRIGFTSCTIKKR